MEVFFLRSLPSGEPVQSRTQRNAANRLLGWIQGDVEKVTQRSPRLMPGHRIPFLFQTRPVPSPFRACNISVSAFYRPVQQL